MRTPLNDSAVEDRALAAVQRQSSQSLPKCLSAASHKLGRDLSSVPTILLRRVIARANVAPTRSGMRDSETVPAAPQCWCMPRHALTLCIGAATRSGHVGIGRIAAGDR